MGRCVMPKPLARPRLAEFDMVPNPLLEPSERAVSLDPVEFSGLSMSIVLSAALLLCLRCLLADTATVRGSAEAPGPGVDFGGAAAIGTTPFPPTAPFAVPAFPWKLVGLLPAVLAPDGPPLTGESLALTLPARLVAGGVEAWLTMLLAEEEMASEEFLRVLVPELLCEAFTLAFFFPDRVLVPPTGKLLPDPRFRFLMTSVLRLSGLTTPWSFKNRPQALQSGWPSGLRRQRGVVWVKQFVHVVGAVPSVDELLAACRFVEEPFLDPGGDDGLLGFTDEYPEACPAASAGGELGLDRERRSNALPRFTAGVDAVRGTFCRRSPPCRND